MNPKLFFTIFSFKNELKYVVLAFLIALSIPVIAVILLTHSGIDIISDKLASVDPQTNTVNIHDPTGIKPDVPVTQEMAWPVKGVVTLEFGENDLPYELFHDGIDIANPYGKVGDPVTPFMDGKVIYAGEIFWGFGKHIIIDHGDNVSSLYGHLDKIFVVKGQEVKLGQVMAKEGTTGWSTGPHLHFGVYVYGIPVNPHTFLGSAEPPI
ncbi:MAG: M23 family metallopeptidase [Candidatus Daviesbacteria bacterium]|nr:M23 family metallopeptidase [Candidatus Daviesbacteria bacterium]